MCLRFFSKVVLFSIFFAWNCSLWADSLDEAAATDLIYAHDRYSPEARKSIYKLMKVQSAIEDYDSDPNSFRQPVYGKGTGRIVRYERLSRDVVKEMVWSQAEVDVNGGSLTDAGFFREAKKWFNIVPGVGPAAKAGMDTFIGLYDRDGETPAMEDLKNLGVGRALARLEIQDPDVVAMFHKDYEAKTGNSMADPLNHPVVKKYQDVASEKSALAKIKSTIDEIQSQREKDKKIQLSNVERKKKRKAFEAQRNEVQSSFGAIGGVLSLTGNNEATAKIEKFAKLVDVSMVLADVTSNMSPMAMANGYLLAANIAMSLMSSGGGAEEAMMGMLVDILKEIEDLKEEMHGRFDRIDHRLGQLLVEIQVTDALNRERHQRLNTQLLALQEMVHGLYRKIDAGTKAEIRRNEINQTRADCLNDDPGKSQFFVFTDLDFNDRCISPLLKLASGNISFELLNMSYVEPGSTFWQGDFVRPYADSFPTILKKIADTGTHELINSNTVRTAPDHMLWRKLSDTFLDIFDEYSLTNPVFTDLDFKKIMRDGKTLVSLRKNLMVKDGKLRWDLINFLMRDYKFLLSGLIRSVAESSVNQNGPGQGGVGGDGYDVTKPLSQPARYRLTKKQRTLSFCDGKNSKGGILAANFNGKRLTTQAAQSWNVNIQSIKMILPDHFETIILSPENLWALKKFPDDTDFCVERHAIKNFIFTGTPRPHIVPGQQYFDNTNVSYTADIRIQLRFFKKPISTVRFIKDYEFANIFSNPIFAISYLYSQSWHGMDAREKPILDMAGKRFWPGNLQELGKKKMAFKKNASAKIWKSFQSEVRRRWSGNADDRAYEHFKDTQFVSVIRESDDLLNLLAGMISVGLNDQNSAKRDVEAVLSEITLAYVDANKKKVPGLISAQELIWIMVYDDASIEKAQARLQLGIERLVSKLKKYEEAPLPLEPSAPPWLAERLLLLENRKERMNDIREKILRVDE